MPVSEQNRIESDWKIIATGSQLAITLKLEPLYSSLKSDHTKDTKMACSVNDLLKHTLKQVTFPCPVKCSMVRQNKITTSANKSSPVHRTSQSRTFHSCFLSQQFFCRSSVFWTPTNSLWSAQDPHQDSLSYMEVSSNLSADFLPALCSSKESPSLYLCSIITIRGIHRSPSVLSHTPKSTIPNPITTLSHPQGKTNFPSFLLVSWYWYCSSLSTINRQPSCLSLSHIL